MWLAHRALPWHLAGLSLLLCLPALGLGWQTDDHIHRAILTDVPGLGDSARPVAELFVFVRSGSGEIARQVDLGALPWWTSERLHLAFFRPLSAASHWLDYRLWPEQGWLMHLQSLLWLGAAVVVATFLYRGLLGSAAVGGLAALAFAVDSSHGLPAFWLANRNAMLALCFGTLALLAHHRWRASASRRGAVMAPVALLLGLLCAEVAVCTMGYLLAYATLLESGRWRGRLLSLVPSGAVFGAWYSVYKLLGYGASDSGVYIDPAASPGKFLAAAWERLPVLLCGQWLLPSDVHMMLSPRAKQAMWWLAVGLVVVLGVVLAPLLKRDRTARFLGAGMLLSLVPACGTFPNDRLLPFASIGGMGLLALLLSGLQGDASWVPRGRWWRRGAVGLCGVLVASHFLLAPVMLNRAGDGIEGFGDVLRRAALSLPSDEAVASQRVLIVNSPAVFVSAFGPLIQELELEGRPRVRRQLTLGSGIRAIELERPDAHTLVVRPEGGYLAPLPESGPAFSILYGFSVFERLFRAGPMRLGERRELTGLSVEVTALTEDGRAAEGTFRFERKLEDPSHRWLRWRDGVYEPFSPPRIGETLKLPAVTVPSFL